jgi:hypothetical protein
MDELAKEIIEELAYRYSTPEERKNLKISPLLIKEILEILQGLGYDISLKKDFLDESFSATAVDNFYQNIFKWIQTDSDPYIPAEQILRDLIHAGWVIKPPKGL